MAQSDQILEALRRGEKITPLDALYKYGCMRLGARIWELKQQGWDIRTEHHPVEGGKHVARYYINIEVPVGTNYQLI